MIFRCIKLCIKIVVYSIIISIGCHLVCKGIEIFEKNKVYLDKGKEKVKNFFN